MKKFRKLTTRIAAFAIAFVLILTALPATVVLATPGATAPGTISGNVTVQQDITGEIIVPSGATLTLVAPHTITGTVTVQQGGTFNMAGGEITGAGTRGVTVNNGTFTMSGGNIWGNGGEGLNTGGGVLVEGSNATFTMEDGTIGGNRELGQGNVVMQHGGGVTVSNGAEFTMDGGQIAGNTVLGASAASFGGGGVSIRQGGTFTFNNGMIGGATPAYGNISAEGGGIMSPHEHFGRYNIFNMTGGTIKNNRARVAALYHGGIDHSAAGGGIKMGGFSNVTITGGLITQNHAEAHGGGAHLTGIAVIENITISYNTAVMGAGGLLVSSSGDVVTQTYPQHAHITMISGIIHGNEGGMMGGGVGVTTYGTFVMEGGTISGNSADFGGGMMAINFMGAGPGTIEFHAGTISGNTARQHGGGVWVTGMQMPNPAITSPSLTPSSFTMHGTGAKHITGNTAMYGGGIWIDAYSNLAIAHATIANNTATRHGGGIWTESYESIEVATNVVFTGNRAMSAHDHGFDNRDSNVDAADSGGGQGGYIGYILLPPAWNNGSIRDTHLLNNYDINYTGAVTTNTVIPRVEGATFPIDKTLLLPASMTAPTSGSFTFSAQLVAETFRNTPIADLAGITVPPATLSVSTMTPYANNDRLLEGTAYLDFSNVQWPHPGRYIFRVTENQDVSGIPHMIYDTSVFYIHVYVGWLDNTFSQLIVLGSDTTPPEPHIFAWPANPATPGSPGIPGSAEGKTYIEFSNAIMPPANLEVEKRVTGVGANPNVPFNFEVELDMTSIPLQHRPEDITAVVTGYQRNPDTGSVILTRENVRTINIPVTNGIATTAGITPPLTLRHGDIITFQNVPLGTRFDVTEEEDDDHEQSGRVVSGGVQTMSETADPGEDLAVYGTVLALASTGRANSRGVFNYVVVTNDYDYTPPTGVFLSNAPFGLMVALGAGALVATGAVAILYKRQSRVKK